jgi:DNA-binding transcriptional ArsR family regulator
VGDLRKFKASLFQALAHPTRLQILEILRGGERSVGALLAAVDRDQANVSQHLTNLRLRGLVVNRKEGNQVFYSVRDASLFAILDLMRAYSATHLSEDMALIRQFRAEAADGAPSIARTRRRAPRRPPGSSAHSTAARRRRKR